MDNIIDIAKGFVKDDDAVLKVKDLLANVSKEDMKIVETVKGFLSKANIDLTKVLVDGKVDIEEVISLGKTLLKMTA